MKDIDNIGGSFYFNSVNERTFSSGSLNHATFEPFGDVHTPELSCSRKSYFSQKMFLSFKSFTLEEILSTFHPKTVKGCGLKFSTIVTRNSVPLASNSKA